MNSHELAPTTKTAMMDLVRKCEGGQVIYRMRNYRKWLCDVENLDLRDDAFYVKLKPLRRVDTAMWRNYPTPDPFSAGAPLEHCLQLRKHAVICTGYVDWCIIFDPVIVEQVKTMANREKPYFGDIISLLEHLERE